MNFDDVLFRLIVCGIGLASARAASQIPRNVDVGVPRERIFAMILDIRRNVLIYI
jgi:hypothetical protein